MKKIAIKSITRLQDRPQVFNFKTEKNHTYIANGLVVHNCDSWYTWMFEGAGPLKVAHRFAQPVKREDSVVEIEAEDLAKKIIELCGPHFKRVVFTGGEPMLQQKALKEVCDLLNKNYHHFDIETETNGTVLIVEGNKYMNQINCSPKLESSGNSKQLRDNPKAIEQFLGLWRDAQLHHLSFKFVVNPETIEQDLAEIEQWEIDHKVPRGLIYLMPEGITQERIAMGTDLLMPICRAKGYNLTTRLHILLYGSRKYV